MPIKKIVVIGPESTGKSSLCRELADHYATPWLPEYAREYLVKNGKEYTYDDLIEIGRGQTEAEDRFISEAENGNVRGPVFLDTDLYVIKIWSEYVFNKCENTILSSIAKREYDLYLLCDIDLPWEPDDLREYPDLESRRRLFHHYHDAMVAQHIPWRLIRGTNEARLQLAISEIDKWSRSF